MKLIAIWTLNKFGWLHSNVKLEINPDGDIRVIIKIDIPEVTSIEIDKN